MDLETIMASAWVIVLIVLGGLAYRRNKRSLKRG
jgi:hypothetical protein